MVAFFSSGFLLFVSPMILISFVVRRRTTSAPDVSVNVATNEDAGADHNIYDKIKIVRRVCYLFCLFAILTFFMAYARLRITGKISFTTNDFVSDNADVEMKSSIDSECLEITTGYKPKDLIGIYGDISGQYHREIDSHSTLSQALFDQGMLHTYGFNTVEGIRNFKACIEEDPMCAMCHWGVAYANGPNINTDVSNAMAVDGKRSIQTAIELMNLKHNEELKNIKTGRNISEENKALIVAQEKEFSYQSIEEWMKKKQQFYDLRYMRSMKEANAAFVDDIDIAVMFAESILNLSPWQYYKPDLDRSSTQYKGHKSQKIKELTDSMKSALIVLRNAIDRSPLHPLALHLWIHVTESSSYPSQGEKEADALVSSAHAGTGTSHLLHMPAHIYLRTGRYHDAVSASVIAIRSDRLYEKNCLVPYVPLHNIAMLVSASLFSGNFLQALEYSPYSSLSLPAVSALHLPALVPTPKDIILTRMGRWKEIQSMSTDKHQKSSNRVAEYSLQMEMDKAEVFITDKKSQLSSQPSAFPFERMKEGEKEKEKEKEIKMKMEMDRESKRERSSFRSNFNLNTDTNLTAALITASHRKTSHLLDPPPYVRAMQAYSQTLAYAGMDDIRRAEDFLHILSESVKSIPYDSLPLDHPFYPNHHEIGEILLSIARSSVILKKNRNSKESLDSTITILKSSVGLQDSFSYMEPESFHFPVRHCLGALLIERSKYGNSEVHREITTQGVRDQESGVAAEVELGSEVRTESESESGTRSWTRSRSGLEFEFEAGTGSGIRSGLGTGLGSGTGTGSEELLLEAVEVYKSDLEEHPNNIWSLTGLQVAYTSLFQIKRDSDLRSLMQNEKTELIGGKEAMDMGELQINIEKLKLVIKDAFANTDNDFQKITGSCCELSLCS